MTLGIERARGAARRRVGRVGRSIRSNSDVRDARARESVVERARESVDVRARGTLVDSARRRSVDEETAARARGTERCERWDG